VLLTEQDWSNYYAATLEKPLHPLYESLDPHLPPSGVALELGCGVGHGVLHLVQRGLRVVAVDMNAEPLAILKSRLPEGADVEVVQSRLEDFDFPSADVIVAGFTLFFLEGEAFGTVWARLSCALKPGGLFMGQLLGPNDDWVTRGYTVHSREEVEELLRGFEILHHEEVERDGETAVGSAKHWHVHHVVARKGLQEP
jgi:tellurite methyltransferase